jgi:hypothetical protein
MAASDPSLDLNTVHYCSARPMAVDKYAWTVGSCCPSSITPGLIEFSRSFNYSRHKL